MMRQAESIDEVQFYDTKRWVIVLKYWVHKWKWG